MKKTEALNKINQLLNQAKANIDQAQSNKDVDSAKTRSIQDIEQIQPHPQTKATGRHRLNEKLTNNKVLLQLILIQQLKKDRKQVQNYKKFLKSHS